MRTQLALLLLLFVVPAQAQDVDLVYDAADVLIGKHAETSSSGVTIHTHSGFRVLVTPAGRVHPNTLDVAGQNISSQIYFVTLDCSGPRYVVYASMPTVSGGIVFDPNTSAYDPHYIPKAAPSVSGVITKELSSNGDCVNTAQAGPSQSLVQVFPNQPGVTGVRNEPYAPPLRLEMAPLALLFELFKDGFELGAFARWSDSAHERAAASRTYRSVGLRQHLIHEKA
jgi:hypothetical protein